MTRINVTSAPTGYYGETKIAGWFDDASATRYEEGSRWDGNNMVSLVTGDQWTHEALFRTAGGRWVLHNWSQWDGSESTYQFIDTESAVNWLIRSEYSESDIENATGETIEAERGPGQPPIGTHVRAVIPDDHMAVISSMIDKGEVKTRSQAIRVLIHEAIAARNLKRNSGKENEYIHKESL